MALDNLFFEWYAQRRWHVLIERHVNESKNMEIYICLWSHFTKWQTHSLQCSAFSWIITIGFGRSGVLGSPQLRQCATLKSNWSLTIEKSLGKGPLAVLMCDSFRIRSKYEAFIGGMEIDQKKLEAAQPDCSIGWSFARIISHFFGWFACSSSFDPADRMGGCSTLLLKFSCMLQFSSVYLFWMGLQCQMHPALSFIIFITPTCCKGALWLVQDNEWEIREEPEKYFDFKDVWNIHPKLSHDHLVCCY